jgi:hypothetical protein
LQGKILFFYRTQLPCYKKVAGRGRCPRSVGEVAPPAVVVMAMVLAASSGVPLLVRLMTTTMARVALDLFRPHRKAMKAAWMQKKRRRQNEMVLALLNIWLASK